MTLGEIIREARKRKGLTQKQLAQRIGVKHGSLSNWEIDKTLPNGSTLIMLMKALELNYSDILDDPSINLSELDDLQTYSPSALTKYQKLLLDIGNAQFVEVIGEDRVAEINEDNVRYIANRKRIQEIFIRLGSFMLEDFANVLDGFTDKDFFELYKCARHIKYDKENPLKNPYEREYIKKAIDELKRPLIRKVGEDNGEHNQTDE